MAEVATRPSLVGYRSNSPQHALMWSPSADPSPSPSPPQPMQPHQQQQAGQTQTQRPTSAHASQVGEDRHCATVTPTVIAAAASPSLASNPITITRTAATPPRHTSMLSIARSQSPNNQLNIDRPPSPMFPFMPTMAASISSSPSSSMSVPGGNSVGLTATPIRSEPMFPPIGGSTNSSPSSSYRTLTGAGVAPSASASSSSSLLLTPPHSVGGGGGMPPPHHHRSNSPSFGSILLSPSGSTTPGVGVASATVTAATTNGAGTGSVVMVGVSSPRSTPPHPRPVLKNVPIGHTRSFSFVPMNMNTIQNHQNNGAIGGVGVGGNGSIVRLPPTSGTVSSKSSTNDSEVNLEQHYRRLLFQSSPFASFPTFPQPTGLSLLCDLAQVVHFERGEHILRLGDIADHILIVGTGSKVSIETTLLSPGSSPSSNLRRLQLGRGMLSPPIALSGFAAARSKSSNSGSSRRMSMPLPQSNVTPKPLTIIREQPLVQSLNTSLNMTRVALSGTMRDEDYKMLQQSIGSPTDEPHENSTQDFPPSTNNVEQPSPIVISLTPTSATMSSHINPFSPTSTTATSPHHGGVIRSSGFVLGCEGLIGGGVGGVGSSRRTYSARVVSEGAEILLISYTELRSKLGPLLGNSNMLESLWKYLISKELDGLPFRPPVPTLGSIHTLTQDTICQPSDAQQQSQPPPSPSSKGLTPCKYTDIDLLLHPLFQKVFYVFCQQESSHELLEFWRDCSNYRSGYNKTQLSMEEEAKILHRAYILPSAKKFQRHLSLEIRNAITVSVLGDANGNGGGGGGNNVSKNTSATDSCYTRLLFLDAELSTETLLTQGSLKSFKTTSAFTKILPFVKLDPKMRQKNELARRSLSSTPTSTPPRSGATTPTNGAGGMIRASAESPPPPLAMGQMSRSHSTPTNPSEQDVISRSCPIVGRSTPSLPPTPTHGISSNASESPSSAAVAAARRSSRRSSVTAETLASLKTNEPKPFVPRVLFETQRSSEGGAGGGAMVAASSGVGGGGDLPLPTNTQ